MGFSELVNSNDHYPRLASCTKNDLWIILHIFPVSINMKIHFSIGCCLLSVEDQT